MAALEPASSPYLVLARKYRPTSFATLIGQDAMVQTLANAFRANRIHHAFILTGVRGVGKTTTARILARAFNFEDETGPHPTLDFSREGIHDRAIIEGRHVDVVEMDAASNTSINDIREITESVKYGPVSAPYKVYIIDEVHMLSTAAFNGLLKTLEEPPPYVKFIFATTEIRKVPVTVLSRCMRFDLRRVAPDVMSAYLASILEREAIGFEPEALAMIVRAGEGSVRDCLSLLDQAIAHGAGTVAADAVKAMLGLADRAATLDLFEAVMAGDIAGALAQFRALYDVGADPQTVVSDLANLTHLITRLKIVPQAEDDPALTPDERTRGAGLAKRLSIRALTRAWQVLFKGATEVAQAGNGVQAAEMVLVRLAYASDLPSPDEVIARLTAQPGAVAQSAPPMLPPRNGGGAAPALRAAQPHYEPVAAPVATPPPTSQLEPRSFAELVALAGQKRDILLKTALESQMTPIAFEQGRIEIALVPGTDPSIANQLSGKLKEWTGRSWMISIATVPAGPTLRDEKRRQEQAVQQAAHDDPLVQAILSAFPGAKLVNVRLRDEGNSAPETGLEAIPEPDDSEEDW